MGREQPAGLDQDLPPKDLACDGLSWAICVPAHLSIPAFAAPKDMSTSVIAHGVCYEQETRPLPWLLAPLSPGIRGPSQAPTYSADPL